MKPIAAFIMQGRWQPILFMAATTLLPLLAWLGGAALALVTLRRGAADGLVTLAGATLALGLIFGAMGANPLVSAAGLLEYWVPVFLLALVLRATVSLALTVMAGAALGMVALVVWYLLVPDPAAFWERSLAPLIEGQESGELMQAVLPAMSGFWMLGLWAIATCSLLLGRWWQAVLYNPGGFREEFHGLRLDWRIAVGALLVLLAATFTGPGLINDLSLLIAGVFTLQALAAAHAVRVAKGWHWAIMVPVYALMPFLFKLYALLGIVDTWFDLRRRVMAGNGG
ncbi:hypothetical protein [Aquisalimonas sp.]|uniref:hypothetical protein n=1 Tax=Aquisalimonas sp. TaxID=1872621 RepID=UPI0025BA0635|nr:hypothetical protein [Aquisalimonas sp.]